MKVLGVLQRGGGPDIAFRAYLLTAIRRLRVDKIRSGSKLQTSDDMEMFDPGVPFRDTTIEGFENEAAARAFASLPERWQLVLWHTEVEEQKPADIAPLLGMSANSVSALAYRAREGLRQAFLNEHVADIEGETCRWTHDHIGPYIRNGLSKRDVAKVDQHLEECRACAAIYLELVDVNSNLGAIIAPLLLGSAAAAYLATPRPRRPWAWAPLILASSTGPRTSWSPTPASAAGGVAAAAAVAGLAFVAITDGPVTARQRGGLRDHDDQRSLTRRHDPVRDDQGRPGTRTPRTQRPPTSPPRPPTRRRRPRPTRPHRRRTRPGPHRDADGADPTADGDADADADADPDAHPTTPPHRSRPRPRRPPPTPTPGAARRRPPHRHRLPR